MDEDLNLTPMIDIFIILIFFLLLTAVFAKVAVIDIYLPQEGQAGGAAEPNAPVTILAIKITEKGFELGGIGGNMFIPKTGQGLNYRELTNKLAAIKEEYPQKEDAIFLFDQDIPYDTVVKVMDASRETSDSPRKTLFPLVSLGENR
jgi:biopolymer transport protein ExbD